MAVQIYRKGSDGLWRCRGRDPLVGDFAIGSTRPVASNTGLNVAGVAVGDLTLYDGNLTINTPGTVIDRMLIRGQVKINADYVTVRNSLVAGRTVTSKFANAMIETVGNNVLIENVEITQYDTTKAPAVDNSTYYNSGIQIGGGSATVRRCDIHDVVDGVVMYNGGVGQDVAGNFIHDLCFRNDDLSKASSTPAYWSHNDGIQIGAGVGHYFHGNNIDCRYSQHTGMGNTNPAMRNFHGIFLQSNNGVVTGLRIEYNWVSHGNICIQFSSPPPNLPGGIASMLGNRVTPNQAVEYSSYKQMDIYPNSTWTVTGADTTVYSDDDDTPEEWRGQPIKPPYTQNSGTETIWAFNPSAPTP